MGVWDEARRQGVAWVDPSSRVDPKGCEPGYVPPQYEWLTAQLVRRRGWTPGRLPWWAYCAKPDLRRCRHRPHMPRLQARLELELPPERAFVIPCWAWNAVHCQDYVAFSQAEERDWRARMLAAVPLDPDATDEPTPLWPLPEPWRSELEASWERLFDPRLPAIGWSPAWGDEREAVFEEIRREDVRKVAPFTAVGWPASRM
jgi:hypothetical protein